MEVNVQRINGNWDLGYSLDKHVLSSTYIGDNQWGHPEFDTTRSEVGEALYQLKYRSNFNQVASIASQLSTSLSQYFSSACLVIPMPPSKQRARQPVVEIARALARNMGIPCYENLLLKNQDTPQMKDIENREEKVETLVQAFAINDSLGEGQYDVLIVDDLYDSGSSLEAATRVLREYGKIRNVYVATATRKH
ncbi:MULTISPECIES: ComF family protein [unclassified Halomonas]|uniref:ComF family protein n=1 Tax=unclassified Halomonas TaxID=2609666 RepID=UPI002887DDC5|nr:MULTISPECIES: ComF family protein [unclassified Halomonas]MDT0499521.1 ComF family protein [Halomonas sp. PAR7]MDT0592325.1 ComF family protein [Halomonas sp. PAR8]